MSDERTRDHGSQTPVPSKKRTMGSPGSVPHEGCRQQKMPVVLPSSSRSHGLLAQLFVVVASARAQLFHVSRESVVWPQSVGRSSSV